LQQFEADGEGTVPQLIGRNFSNWLQDEFKPGILLPSLTSGAILGVTEVIFAISLGSLIFSGELTPFLSRGIGIALFTAAAMMFVTAMVSKVPGVFGSTQDTTSVILAVMAAGLVSALSGVALEEKLATIVVAIAAASLLTGIFFILLGSFKLGGLMYVSADEDGLQVVGLWQPSMFLPQVYGSSP
jgi:SulP family sulfate permease